MMGQQTQHESLFFYFRLEEQIPEDHLLRLIDHYIDLSFVRGRLKRFYSRTGRPSPRFTTRSRRASRPRSPTARRASSRFPASRTSSRRWHAIRVSPSAS